MRRTWGAALAAIVAACGQGSRTQRELQSVPPVQGGGNGQPAAAPCTGGVTVHLDGIDPGDVTSLEVGVASVAFTGAGFLPLQADSTASGALDVAAACQDLAVLALPQAGPVHGTISLGTTHACVGGSCFDLDACTKPIAFQFDPAKVSPERCDVVVSLDLARSVYAAGDVRAFLPHFLVHY